MHLCVSLRMLASMYVTMYVGILYMYVGIIVYTCVYMYTYLYYRSTLNTEHLTHKGDPLAPIDCAALMIVLRIYSPI